jgi:transcriptional regulator with XRE-family HTH domain
MSKKRSRRPAAETLAGSIKARMKARELTPYRVAKMSGVSAVVIQRFVNGERDIKLETAEKLCSALELVLVPRGD